jgi:16S rRNA G966 N2-methylase RsmD
VLEAIADLDLLSDTGELAVEHSPQLPPPEDLNGLEILRKKVYGNSAVTFYQVHQSS